MVFVCSIGKKNRFAIVIRQQIFIIAGCNGAGKTSAVNTWLPQWFEIRPFINADEIARGLSPFQSDAKAVEAGRIMLSQMQDYLSQCKSFSFETTLSTRSFSNMITDAQRNGYQVNMLFLWLSDVSVAKDRVRNRVKEGGHFIDEKTIERRYHRGLQNLFERYLPLLDQLVVVDNSLGFDHIIAFQHAHGDLKIVNAEKWNKMAAYERG